MKMFFRGIEAVPKKKIPNQGVQNSTGGIFPEISQPNSHHIDETDNFHQAKFRFHFFVGICLSVADLFLKEECGPFPNYQDSRSSTEHPTS